VEITIADHFILLHYQHQIAATINLALGQVMIVIFVVHIENVAQVKDTVIVTMNVLLG